MMMREVIDRKEDFLLLDRCRKGVKIRVDLLTIAAKIAIISDISVCTSLLFCENTRKAIRASARWGAKVRAPISIDGGRCVFEPIGYDKRAASHENCVVLFG